MPEGNVAGADDIGGPDAWFKSLPFITRYWFATTAALTLGANFGIVSPMRLLFVWPAIQNKFEIWRFVTSFCYAGAFSFPTLFAVYMLVQFSKQYEAGGPYNTGGGGGTADYAFMLLFGAAAIMGTFPLLRMVIPLSPVFCRTLTYYVLYVWSKRNPTSPANIWGVPMKGMYLPFAYLAITVLCGNPYFDILHGLAIGHVFYFLVDVVPLVYGKDLLHTPQFLIDFFGIGEYVQPAPVVAARGAVGNNTVAGLGRSNAPNESARRGGGHNWGGGGRALGSE